jgi:hypothetical protein
MSDTRCDVTVTIGTGDEMVVLSGRLERALAPTTCTAVTALLPLRSQLVHVRWSGEGVWIPMADIELELAPENATAHPLPGQAIIYADPLSENEVLLAYGATSFASIAGPLAGNHFLTVDATPEQLREIGQRALWDGAQAITIAFA